MRALVLAALLTSCGGNRCHEVEQARTALTSRGGAPHRAADVEIDVPLARANLLLAKLLELNPIALPIEVPAIGPVDSRQLTAKVGAVELRPGAPNMIRFSVTLQIGDASTEVTELIALVDIAPVVTPTELSIAVGPTNVISIEPRLSADAGVSIGRAIGRWVPHVPQAALDIAARELGGRLTGVAWRALRESLLKRLGSVTTLSIRLPDVPIARTAIRSDEHSLTIALTTDLPVRAGLAAETERPDDITVRIAASAAAELANWAIDQKHAPAWYDRGLTPRADGEFRPRFDYVAGSHPFKIFAFQERGGCSFFRIGADASLRMASDQLEVIATDQRLEAVTAHPVVEAAAWTKFFLFGWIDEAKRIAVHTQFRLGGGVLETRVIGAVYARDELAFTLNVFCCVPSPPANGVADRAEPVHGKTRPGTGRPLGTTVSTR